MYRVCLPTHTDIEDTHVSQSLTVYYIFAEPATCVAKARQRFTNHKYSLCG